MKVDYVSLSGGLDLSSNSLAAPPGRLASSVNFEQVFGKVGYRRIDGYERFDGRPQPHMAVYHVLEFEQGSSAILNGDVLSGPGASATVLGVELSSGSWSAGNASGMAYIVLTSGAWAAGQDVVKGGLVVAKAQSEAYRGRAQTSDAHAALTSAAASLRRSVIQQPPGSGPVRGVAVHDGLVYSVRDAADGLTAEMWVSSIGGWTSIKAGLLPGGRYEFVSANFTGDTKTKALFGCDGRNPPFKYASGAYTEMDPIFGSQATSTTSTAVATGSKTFSVVEPSRSYAVGDVLLIHSKASAANRMVGTVTAFSQPSLTVNVTEAIGSGAHADWNIGKADYSDKPYLLTAHKDHLFLAYPRGQLQTSNTGDPMKYTSMAGLFGLGDEITGLTSMKGAVLGVFCDNRVSLLEGSSELDWRMSIHAQNLGTKLYTVQENGGSAIFFGERGLLSLQGTASYGDFEPSIFSRNVKPLLDRKLDSVVGTRMVRGKYQYRIYFGDGTVMSACILSPNPVVQPGDVSFMPLEYRHRVSCVASGAIDGEDYLVFGTDDGWVMREDVGTSFDGDHIASALSLHFNHFKNPAVKKRYYKLTLELDAEDAATIRFRQMFDLSDGFYFDSLTQFAGTSGTGGNWNVNEWDTFYWSLPYATQVEVNVDGVSRNMALVLWHESATDRPFNIQGLMTQYKLLGLSR